MEALGDAILAAKNWDNYRDAVRAFLQHPDFQRHPINLRSALSVTANRTTSMTEVEVAMSKADFLLMDLPHNPPPRVGRSMKTRLARKVRKTRRGKNGFRIR